jgi:hypothetical protein
MARVRLSRQSRLASQKHGGPVSNCRHPNAERREPSAKLSVIWQRAADASNHLESGHVLCVAHSNEKVADQPCEKRFRDMPNEQHTRAARDRVRALQQRPRELADGGGRFKGLFMYG